jgi:hypothetical protein
MDTTAHDSPNEDLSAAAPNETTAEDSRRRPLYTRRLDALGGKTLEQTIQVLADREEIRDLTAIYAHRVAHGLANADLFTDDGAYINRRSPDSAGTEVRGRAALDAHFIERPGGAGGAMPMIHNHLIEIDGDDASAVCSIELRVGENGVSTIASGYYQDRLRREDGRWKFVLRDVTFFHWAPLLQGWAEPPKSNGQ